MQNSEYSPLPEETKEEYAKRIYQVMEREKVELREKMVTGEVKTVFEVDDFGFLLPGFDDLKILHDSFPDFKVTVFTIPFPNQFFGENAKHFKTEKYKQWAAMVNACDWIEVAIHGFYHVHFEFDCSYQKAQTAIKAWENLFEEIGLKYVKIFRAPYWQYSYDALQALKDAGYVVAIDRNHPRPVPEGLKTYIYNWSFEEVLPPSNYITGHGHFIGQNQNNIKQCLPNILNQIPEQTKFIKLSEYLEVNQNENEHPEGNN